MFLNSTSTNASHSLSSPVLSLAGHFTAALATMGNTTKVEMGRTVVAGSMEEEEDSNGGNQVVIGIAVVFLVVVVSICGLLCYREVVRRRIEAYMSEEFLRKEEIKRAIKKKLIQMQNDDDSDSYEEEMKLKVPMVTFGDVTKISPAHSTEALNRDALHRYYLHHHHHHHYHHHYNHAKSVLFKEECQKPSKESKQKINSSSYKIPRSTSRAPSIPFLFSKDKNRSTQNWTGVHH